MHLSILLAALVLVRAASYWLDRYSLTTKDSRLHHRHRPTPTRTPCCRPRRSSPSPRSCARCCSSRSIWTRSWRLPVVGVALLVVASVVGRAASTRRSCRASRSSPREKSLEAPYIERNIKATRAAYGLDRRRDRPPTRRRTDRDAGPAAQRRRRRSPASGSSTPSSCRPTFKQLQAVKSYYAVPRRPRRRPLHDRRQGARHRDRRPRARPQRRARQPAQLAQRPHGLHPRLRRRRGLRQPARRRRPAGLLSSRTSRRSARCGTFEPRIYFGEQSPDYSIVGGPAGSPQREFDYPDSSAAGQKNNTYTGKGGVAHRQLVRAQGRPTRIKYRELNFMLSDAVNGDSPGCSTTARRASGCSGSRRG